jgi:hypothetical protein
MMHFSLASWKNSITLLRWDNLRLFTLVSCKTFFRGIPLILTHFWWALAVHGLIQIFLPSSPFCLIFKTVTTWLMIYIYCMALRPSLEIKNQLYFAHYGLYIFYFSLIALSLFGLYFLSMGIVFMCNVASLGEFLSVNEFVQSCFSFPTSWEITYPISMHILFPLRVFFSFLTLIIVCTCILLAGLFELDNPHFHAIPSSIRSGILMIGYNFPVILLLGGIFSFIAGSNLFFSQWYDSHSFVAAVATWIIKELILVFIVSLIINFYLKIKHSNYSLFISA